MNSRREDKTIWHLSLVMTVRIDNVEMMSVGVQVSLTKISTALGR
jgi:hypothetical protein